MLVGREKRLTLIKTVIAACIAFSGGIVVAGGVIAFITMIGIIPRLASRTNTVKYILPYEYCVIIGGILGNFWAIYEMPIRLGVIGLIFFGTFSGMFIGCLAIALAEVIDVIPVFAIRISLRKGISIIVLCLALGKCMGSLYQLVLNR